MALLWRYYWPSIRTQLPVLAAIVLVAFWLEWLSFTYNFFDLLISGVSVIMSCAFCMGALVFAGSRTRLCEAQLPCTPQERTLFAMAYALIVVPAVLAAVYYLNVGIATLCGCRITDPECLKSLDRYGAEVVQLAEMIKPTTADWIFGKISSVIPMLAAIFVAVRVRKHAVLMTILAVVGAFFALGIVGGITGAVYMFTSGFMDGIASATSPDQFEAQFPQKLAGVLKFSFKLLRAIAIVAAILTALCWWRTVKFYKTRNV